ncbi:MAG: hypothetical protein LIP09_02500 [Bacteroidales bacterium]|nr:hypothetical protein [Bacteroidales bacterium]
MNKTCTVYHGTDERIVAMSEEDRKYFLWFCPFMAEHLRGYFPQDPTKMDFIKNRLESSSIPHLLINTVEKIQIHDLMKSGCKEYQYENFYVTGNFSTAKSYAYRSFAFGELGLITYRLLQAAMELGLTKYAHFPLREYCKKFLDFAEGEEKPIVYVLNNVDLDLIKMPNGSPIPHEIIESAPNLTYHGEIVFDKWESHPL